MEVQKSGASWDSSGMALEEEVAEKPETRLGCLSSRAGVIQKEQQPMAAKRYAFFFFFFCILHFTKTERAITPDNISTIFNYIQKSDMEGKVFFVVVFCCLCLMCVVVIQLYNALFDKCSLAKFIFQ